MAMSGVKEIAKDVQDEVANDSASDIHIGGNMPPGKQSAFTPGAAEPDAWGKCPFNVGHKGDSKRATNDNVEIGSAIDGEPIPQQGDLNEAQKIDEIAMALREAGDRIDRMFSNRFRRDTQILAAYAVFITVVGLINLFKGGSSANPGDGAGHGGQL